MIQNYINNSITSSLLYYTLINLNVISVFFLSRHILQPYAVYFANKSRTQLYFLACLSTESHRIFSLRVLTLKSVFNNKSCNLMGSTEFNLTPSCFHCKGLYLTMSHDFQYGIFKFMLNIEIVIKIKRPI